ncbi:hypothetical protein CC78DRAFT_585322 [Lojkania enalia]|uniref:Uncharacterized protein n=1 Tax=Lojkania enalia TaxID=147567 RepID=A0A9P4K0N7_9PLEO|nr:hypothetical protein CC78DRAFT_585322 [Didymosphaeria enalia]
MSAARTASITVAALLLIDAPYSSSQSRENDLRPAPLNYTLSDTPDLAQKSLINERVEGQQVTEPPCAPPACLVLCKEYFVKQEDSSDVWVVDLHRHERLLGWEASNPGLIKTVVEIDANHYNILDVNDSLKMESLMKSLKEGLAILDSPESTRKISPFQQ